MLREWTADSETRESAVAFHGRRHAVLSVDRRADGGRDGWMFRVVGIDRNGALVSREGVADTREGARRAAEARGARRPGRARPGG
jgi:hypothetical protein